MFSAGVILYLNDFAFANISGFASRNNFFLINLLMQISSPFRGLGGYIDINDSRFQFFTSSMVMRPSYIALPTTHDSILYWLSCSISAIELTQTDAISLINCE